MRTITACIALTLAGTASAFDPANADWSKNDPAHLRVMTWNVEDGLCSTASKSDSFNGWNGLARITAMVKPDVLILQETADNSGNGDVSGGSVDSVATMENVLDLFIHGGADPYRGGMVDSYIQAFDPALDYPYIRVSGSTDNFNRNVIMSRYPFADINGSGDSCIDSFFNLADEYAPGGGSGIRGFQFCEIDLPDAVYAGDLVIGNAHLKAGGSSSDVDQRREAAQNVAYFIDYQYNGAGTGMSDPNNKIFVNDASSILGENDVVIFGGDWNEDEATNGRKGPAEWLTRALNTGGTDGTDRDRTDSVYDNAADPFTGNTDTRGGSKLDYIAWQDSVATAVEQVVVYTNTIPAGQYPPELDSFSNPSLLSGLAADHQAVFVDFQLPAPVVAECIGDFDSSGDVGSADLAVLLAAWGSGFATPDLDNSGMVDSADLAILLAAWGSCPV